MFLFKASRYVEELRKFRPDIYQACAEAKLETEPNLDFLRIIRRDLRGVQVSRLITRLWKIQKMLLSCR